jgi:hypothetical protein
MAETNLAVNIDDIDIDAEIRNIRSLSGNVMRPVARLESVEYNPTPTVNDVGRLSAEALAMSYESAAKELEELGQVLIGEVKANEVAALDVVKDLERQREVTRQAVEQVKETAGAYRAEAKELSDHVQSRALAADNVRVVCLELVNKIKTT